MLTFNANAKKSGLSIKRNNKNNNNKTAQSNLGTEKIVDGEVVPHSLKTVVCVVG